jgi:flagellar basal body rod protein FlgG
MIYGLYLSAQGAEAQSFRQDVIGNNLANSGTTAFKRDLAIIQAHLPFDAAEGRGGPAAGNVNDQTGGISLATIRTDFSPGALQRTGGDLDLALAGPGFLRVTNGTQEFLTRDGRFEVDLQGNLVTSDQGYRVLNANGLPVQLDVNGGPLEITGDGVLSQNAGTIDLGRLGLAEPVNYLELEKVGQNLFQAHGPVTPASPNTQIKQGHLETSGTQPTSEMLDLIQSSRALEANVNMIKYQDEAVGKLLESLPRR